MSHQCINDLEHGAHVRHKAPKFFWSCPSRFGYTSAISRFGERFRDDQYSLVSFLIAVLLQFYSRCPRAQPFVKVEDETRTCPRGVSVSAPFSAPLDRLLLLSSAMRATDLFAMLD